MARVQVQTLIGAKKAVALDLTAACSGFVVGLVLAAQNIRTGLCKNILVIGADALSRYVDWRDRGLLLCFIPFLDAWWRARVGFARGGGGRKLS
jgi:3-oxoacyl-[acyl-carrier-protein] synthase III